MRLGLLLAAGLMFAHGATGATHVACVSTAGELTDALAALSTSTANTDADEIRLRTGTYVVPAGGFVGAVSNHHDLTIRGGWLDAGCSAQSSDASLTILDGDHAAGVLTIGAIAIPDSNIEVSGLTFQNGNASAAFANCAGGLKVADSGPISNGNILIERNIFRNNSVGAGTTCTTAAGALVAATDGTSLVVRGNLFVDNSAPAVGAMFLYSNNAIDTANNTFTRNEATDGSVKPRYVFDYFTLSGVNLSNSIFWNDTLGADAFDVNLSGQFISGKFRGATLLDDDIQTPGGTPVQETGTLNVDPKFAGTDDFRLSASSPLIDAGANAASGGLSDVDLDGAPRVDATIVDIGTYESSFVFVSGFD